MYSIVIYIYNCEGTLLEKIDGLGGCIMDAMPHGPVKHAPRRRYTPLRYRAAAPTAWRAPVATVGRRHPGA